MKLTLKKVLGFFGLLILACAGSVASNSVIATVEEYNRLLPFWGISWSPGNRSVNGYYPSFYTGFVMRSEYPDRIHVRTSRGNQTRVSVILDNETINDYLFDLVKRQAFYGKMTSGPKAPLQLNPGGSNTLGQLNYYNQIIDSKEYGIGAFVSKANAGGTSAEEIYTKSLSVLSTLNSGRVFNIKIDLIRAFRTWKDLVRTSGSLSAITANPRAVVAAINNLLPGRINFTDTPSAVVITKLSTSVQFAYSDSSDDLFIAATYDLFRAVTGAKYAFKVLNTQTNQFEDALKCGSSSCTLSYPEFTAIYPTGSIMEKTSDEFGNDINSFATPGLWQFIQRGDKGVDNIRDEPYYGFVPKLDYEGIGNGFHNPAVRFWDPSKDLKKGLGIPANHNTLWAVKRGGVSHGCLRLPLGHLWEMRHIFPVENEKMSKISFFGNRPQDFDVYDIRGDGEMKVMGVEYLISYGLQGTDGLANREGTGFEINTDKKNEFYSNLYGKKNVFEVNDGQTFEFVNPKISIHSYLDFKKKSVAVTQVLQGKFPLYEQPYEREKVQLYAIGSITPETKKLIRLMGRVRGCSPTSDKKRCGEASFDEEQANLVQK